MAFTFLVLSVYIWVLWPHTSADWFYDVDVDEEKPNRPELNLTDLRLVGGFDRCAGIVKYRHKGEIQRLVFYNTDGHMESRPAFAVCRVLDCGSPISVKHVKGYSPKALSLSAECVSSKNNIQDCVKDELLDTEVGFQVVCSAFMALVPSIVTLTPVQKHCPKESLDPPTLSLSVTDGVSQAEGQSVWVLLGSQFIVQCSVNPQYPEGSFKLLSPSGNRSLPAVNHTAHFLFNNTGFSHKGDYTCVFFDYSSSASESLQLWLGVKDSDLIMRAVVLLLMKILYILPMIYCYSKAKARGGTRERMPQI